MVDQLEIDRTPIDLAKVKEAATNFQGCSILDALEGKSLQEQINAIKQIGQSEQVQSTVYVTANESPQYTVDLLVKKVNPGLMNPDEQIFFESFDPTNGTITYSCTDLKGEKNSSHQSKTVSF
jgi:hypothetical protein